MQTMKDYKLIAATLKDDRLDALHAACDRGDLSAETHNAIVLRCDVLVDKFADMLAADNPRFSRAIFCTAAFYNFGTVSE